MNLVAVLRHTKKTMPAAQRYLTSLQKNFSTFLTQNYVTGGIAQQAESLYLNLLGWKTDYSKWSVEEIRQFLLETQLNTNVLPQVQSLLTQFVKDFPPHQANVFLHEYLLATKRDGCSSATIRNYRSDIRQYVRFAETGQFKILFTKPKLAEFVNYQLEKGLKESSVTRKLSSISQFGWWLQTEGLLNQDLKWMNQSSVKSLSGIKTKTTTVKPKTTPTTAQFKPGMAVVKPAVGQNRRFGLKKKLRELTNSVKQTIPTQTRRWLLPYLNLAFIVLVFLGLGYFGYRQLFVETTGPLAYPSTPTRPNRVLSFQGRLTDTAQNPITTSTNLRFYLYDALTGGSSLWDSTACSVTPDQDGIFTVNLGDDCGSEIGSDVFSENANIWLEAIVEAETLTPRQPIRTVAYAVNAETVQGYPIDSSGSATVNTIVTMNDVGDIVLGEVSPKIKAVSGTFTLEGEALTLTTTSGSDGDITFDPDGIGGVISNAYFAAPGATFSATYAGGLPLKLNAFTSTGTALDISGSATTSANISLGGQLQLGRFGANPTAMGEGSMVYNTTDDKLYYYNGVSWAEVGSGGGGSGASYWRLALGAISPVNDTLDLLVGSDATTSAKAAFLNINSGTPTASVSAGVAGGAYLTADGTLATTALQSLTLGDNTTTGNVILNPAGNIGIGTATPGYKLEVVGDTQFDSNVYFANGTTYYVTSAGNAKFNDIVAADTANPGLTVGDGSSGYFKVGGSTISDAAGNLSLDSDTDILYTPDTTFEIGGATSILNFSSATGAKQIQTGGTTHLGLMPGGNMGVGTTTPGAKLTIVGGDVWIDTGQALFTDTIRPFTGDQLTFLNGGTNNAYFNGNVGIGDNTPTEGELVVAGRTYTTNLTMTTGASAGYYLTSDASGNASWADVSASAGPWTLNGTDLYPDDTGYNVGIGTANPLFDLDISGSASISSTLSLGPILQVDAGTCNASSEGKQYYDAEEDKIYYCDGSSWTALGAGGGSSYWRLATGALSPINNTLDVLIGSDASTSAKAAFLNIDSGTPTASVSAGAAGGAYLTADGILATTALQTLTLGDSTTTGNIIINPSGNIGIGSASAPTALLDLADEGRASGYRFLEVGDDAYFTDVDGTNFMGLYGQTNIDRAGLRLGSDGSYIFGDAGNIGIGDDSPDAKLFVEVGGAGSEAFDTGMSIHSGDGSYTTGHGPMLQFENENVVLAGIRGIREDGWTSGLQFFTHNSTADNTYGTSFSERMRISGDGYVGVGTTSPTALLDIAGDASSSGTLSFRGTTDPKINILDGENFGIQTSIGGDAGLSEAFTILNNGNIGIGAATPGYKLEVSGDAQFDNNIYFANDTTYYVSDAGNAKFNDIIAADTGNPGITIGDGAIGSIKIGSSTITDNSTTYLGIDPDTDSVSEFQFQDDGDFWLESGSILSGVADSASAVAFTLDTDNALSTYGSKLLSISNSGTEKMYLDKDGNLYVSGNIISGSGGYTLLLTNKSGGTVSTRSIVIIDESNNSAFTTTTTPYSKNAYGVVVGIGLGVSNDADGDGNCDADDICVVAVSGEAEVTTTNATSASKGDYLFTSDTAGSAVVSGKQYDGLVGIVTDTSGSGSGYIKMMFKAQPQVTALATMDKYTKHNLYQEALEDYNQTSEAGYYDDSQNIRKGLYFDSLVDQSKIDHNSNTAAIDTTKQRVGLWGGQTYNATNTDPAGNNYLGAADANDVYYYDRSQTGDVNAHQDSTPATLVDLGTDPYWYDGVSLINPATGSGTLATNPPANLTEWYNGGLIDVTGTITTEDGYIDIEIISQTATTLTFNWNTSGTTYSGDQADTAVFGTATSLIDDSGDSDTGIGVKFTKVNYHAGDTFRIHSWYIEPATTNDRGNKQQFPERSYIVATGSGVDIIDADTNRLWMRFDEGSGYILGSTNVDASAVHALNGTIYITDNNGTDALGLHEVSFSKDNAYLIDDDAIDVFNSGVADRNSNLAYTEVNTGLEIVDDSANDVHAAIICTGNSSDGNDERAGRCVTPKTYTAVSTDGGASVIDEKSQSAIDLYYNGTYKYSDFAWLTTDGKLYFGINNSSATSNTVYIKEDIHTLTTDQTITNSRDFGYFSTSADGVKTTNAIASATEKFIDITVTENTSTIDNQSHTVYLPTEVGLQVIQEKEGDETNGSLKVYTKDYISEEMVGDVRGMWPLNYNNANADNEDISIKGNDLTAVNIDSNDAVSGVRSKAVDFDGSTEYLYRAFDTDFNFTSSVTLGAWIKTSSLARQGIVVQTGCDNDTSGCGYHPYSLYMDNGNITGYFSDSVGATLSTTSPTTYADNQWHHVTTTFESGVIKLYVDGYLVNTGSLGSTLNTADNDRFFIGAEWIYLAGVTNFFSGTIDEPFITAEALTADQVKRMYENGKRALEGSHGTNDYKNNLSDDGTGAGGTDITKAVGVDENGFMYVGMDGSGADDGWVSKIDLGSDTQVDQYTASTDMALADNDVTSLSVSPSGLEIVGNDGIGVKSFPIDTEGNDNTGSYYSDTIISDDNFSQAYLWVNSYTDSSDSSNSVKVYASNDGGANYIEGTLTSTDSNQDVPEKEYFFHFNTADNDLKVRIDFARGSAYSNAYATKWGITWIGEDAGASLDASNGLYTNTDTTVADGDYVEVVHNGNTSDLLSDGWIYNTTTSKWEQIDVTDNQQATSSSTVNFNTEANYTQEDIAYAVTLTPSAATGNITLTLGSGNWNSDARVQTGCRVTGNGGVADITGTPAAQTTISAITTTDFTNTNAIASGSWNLYCTTFDGSVAKINSSSAVAATGGTITYSGGYTIHTFTSSGTLSVTVGGDVETLVIGGGGGGGGGNNGNGGGGGGGYLEGTFAVTAGSKAVVVGAGGTGGTNAGGAVGGNSTFNGATALGGGGGGGGSPDINGDNGGSGGGGGPNGTAGSATQGNSAGLTGYGNNGGTPSSGGYGGGGGGAGGVGGGGTTGVKGAGKSSSITGSAVTYSEGGAYTVNGNSGAANSGDGGEGEHIDNPGGNGGSGIVIVKYLTAVSPLSTYYSVVTDADQITTTSWQDIDSVSVTETLDSQTINYAVSFDGRTTFHKYDSTSENNGWRPIARNNSGTWQYNNNTSAGVSNVTWTNATYNSQNGATSQAAGVTQNQMTGTQLAAVTDAQWNEVNGFTSTTNTLDFSATLKTTNNDQIPEVDQIKVNYTQAGYKIIQQDANTARLYNYSGSTQNLRLDVITGGSGRNSGTVSLHPLTADIDASIDGSSLWINKTGTGGNLLRLQQSGSDILNVGQNGGDAAMILDQNLSGDIFTASASGTTKFVINNSGNVGIGESNPSYDLDIDASSTRGINITQSQTADINGTGLWVYNAPSSGTLSTNGNHYGIVSQLFNENATSLGAYDLKMYGIYSSVKNTATQTLTSAYGLYSTTDNTNASGTITNAFGAYIDVNHTAGTITNGYGLYLANVETTNSTNDWGIYQAGTNDTNYFGGTTNFAGNLINVGGINGVGDQESMAPNSGFEINDDSDNTLADGWSVITSTSGTDPAVATTNSVQGTNSQRMYGTSTTNTKIKSQCFPVTDGNTYNLYVWAKSGAASGDGFALRLVTFPDPDCGGTNTNQLAASGGTTTTWTKYGGSTGAVTGVSGYVGIYNVNPNNATHMYFDSVRLTPSAETNSIDIAENYYSDESLEPGQLVKTNEGINSGVSVADRDNQSNLIGIVSTNPAITLGEGLSGEANKYIVKVALSGRVPTIVSTKNGSFESGDIITSSSDLPGIGVKSINPGKTVGTTLESTKDWSSSTCQPVSNVSEIVWPDDDGSDAQKRSCFALPDGTFIGKIMVFVNTSWHNPDIYLTDTGDFVLEGNSLDNYTIATPQSNINRISAFAQSIIANLKAGSITAQIAQIAQLSTEQLTIGGQNIREYIIDLFDELTTERTIPLQLESDTVDPNTGEVEYATLEITNASGSAVASFNSQGDLSLLGELNAASISAETVDADLITGRSARLEQLESRMAEFDHIKAQTAELVDATISGTLYATKIEGLDDQLAETLNTSSFLDNLLGKKAEATQSASLASLFTLVEGAGYATDSGSLIEPPIYTGPTSDVSLVASAAFINDYFSVNGSGYIAQQLGVGEQLLVGNSMAIGDNFIEYQPIDPETPHILHLQPSGEGTLSLMAGLMTLHENGQVLIDGDLAVSGNLEIGDTLLTDLIKPTTFGDSLQIKLATISGEVAGETTDIESRLEILGITEIPTATISAQGRASFEGGIDIGTEDLTPISTMSATIASSQPSGKATINQNTLGITIKSPLITNNSLIYVSPIGSTGNQILYVKSQTAENLSTLEQEGGFSVGFDAPISHNITFNWWILN